MGIFNKTKNSDSEDIEAVKAEKEVVADVAVKKTAKKEVKPVDDMAPSKKRAIYGILIKPLITEKTTLLASSNQFVFAVNMKANKLQVAQAVESRYGIKPLGVNILKNKGNVVRFGKNWGRTKDWKKAIVTLPKGKSIAIQEGI